MRKAWPLQKRPESLERAWPFAIRFSKKLNCPQCGNEGFAEASEVDDPKRKHPDFKVDQLPRGFGVQRPSNNQENFMIKCECGRKFPFRSVAEAAAERR